jgi:Mn2+/Fe2+ NRAMP family transporter
MSFLTLYLFTNWSTMEKVALLLLWMLLLLFLPVLFLPPPPPVQHPLTPLLPQHGTSTWWYEPLHLLR